MMWLLAFMGGVSCSCTGLHPLLIEWRELLFESEWCDIIREWRELFMCRVAFHALWHELPFISIVFPVWLSRSG